MSPLVFQFSANAYVIFFKSVIGQVERSRWDERRGREIEIVGAAWRRRWNDRGGSGGRDRREIVNYVRSSDRWIDGRGSYVDTRSRINVDLRSTVRDKGTILAPTHGTTGGSVHENGFIRASGMPRIPLPRKLADVASRYFSSIRFASPFIDRPVDRRVSRITIPSFDARLRSVTCARVCVSFSFAFANPAARSSFRKTAAI